MANSVIRLQTKLMKDYYKFFSKYSKGKSPEGKVAWITAFTPVEILEALDIIYYYPESYAAVIAASEKEQEFLRDSENTGLSRDCCSYSCCIRGCLNTGDGPEVFLQNRIYLLPPTISVIPCGWVTSSATSPRP